MGAQDKWWFSVNYCSAVCFSPTIVYSLPPVFLLMTQQVSCLTYSSTPPSWNNCSVWHFRSLELNHIGRPGRFGCNDILDPKMTSDVLVSWKVNGAFKDLSWTRLVQGYFVETSSIFIEALAKLLAKWANWLSSPVSTFLLKVSWKRQYFQAAYSPLISHFSTTPGFGNSITLIGKNCCLLMLKCTATDKLWPVLGFLQDWEY